MAILFSYGMLQRPEVQISTFGRLLEGQPDELVGFVLTEFKVEDPVFVAESGKESHSMALRTGRPEDTVAGIAYDLTECELEAADEYEPDGYVRIVVSLASGREAWLYSETRPGL
jgi:hypothetical protein